MKLCELASTKIDICGAPIPMTIRDTKGQILADFDMDRETYLEEGVDADELDQREVVDYIDHKTYLEVTVQ